VTAPTDPIRRADVLDALVRVGILPEDAAMDAVKALPASAVHVAALRLARALSIVQWSCYSDARYDEYRCALAAFRKAEEEAK
jgi:hypothetical protein